jgi:hypothetical protein
LPPDPATGLSETSALTGMVDGEDRPLFVLGGSGPSAGCLGHGGTGESPKGLVRLTESGRSDSSFGHGDAFRAITGSGSFPTLALDGADQPVVGVGRTESFAGGCGRGTTIYRFDENGRPTAGFGIDGRRVFKSFHLGLVEDSGALVLDERVGRTLELARIRANGTFDRAFGSRGVARLRLPVRVGLHVSPAGVDADGRLLLAGFIGSATSEPEKGQPPSSFAVSRVSSSGKIDRTFGKDGWIFKKVPVPFELTSAKASFDGHGRLLVAGIGTQPGQLDGAFITARFLLGP